MVVCQSLKIWSAKIFCNIVKEIEDDMTTKCQFYKLFLLNELIKLEHFSQKKYLIMSNVLLLTVLATQVEHPTVSF